MNSYLITYQFKEGRFSWFQVGRYQGKTPSEAVKDLEKAGAIIYSIILTGTN